MLYVHYENYKGGINNLCVAYDSETELTATSTKGKYAAVALLDRKIDKAVIGKQENNETKEEVKP